MNVTASATLPQALASGRRWLFPALVLLLCVITTTAVVVGNGSLFAAMAPMAIVGAWGIWKAPVRIPLLGLLFLNLGIDPAGEGAWNTPFAWIGGLLAQNVDKIVHGVPLPLPLTAAILGFLLLIYLHRQISQSRIDDAGSIGFARATVWSIGWSAMAVIGLCAWGLVQGGDTSMIKWQIMAYAMILLAAFLLTVSLRGMRDIRLLALLIVGAACSKALMAIYIMSLGIIPTPVFATSHGDSVLVACGITILVVRFIEEPRRWTFLPCLFLVPIMAWGLIANNRRLAWAELGAVAVVLFILSKPSRLKRVAIRSLLLALPLLIMYVGVGWSSSSRLFAPVRTFRSMQDSTVDSSTLFRETENYNLLISMRSNPVIGSGFGHPFRQVVQTYDISFFREYLYLPHNSILGLWTFTGVFGFTGLFLALSVCVFLASRSYGLAQSADERTAAFSAIAMVLIYLIQCWGDIGFQEGRSIFLLGAAIAVAGKVAVSTGAWGQQQKYAQTARG